MKGREETFGCPDKMQSVLTPGGSLSVFLWKKNVEIMSSQCQFLVNANACGS